MRFTQFGFDFGPMTVERVAYDDRLGWVVQVRSADNKQQVIVRCSPQGKNWHVENRTHQRKPRRIR